MHYKTTEKGYYLSYLDLGTTFTTKSKDKSKDYFEEEQVNMLKIAKIKGLILIEEE